MARRKPPSQRAERKMDETARAIARLQERPEAEKSKSPQRPDQLKTSRPRSEKGFTPRLADAAPVYPSTKKPKTG